MILTFTHSLPLIKQRSIIPIAHIKTMATLLQNQAQDEDHIFRSPYASIPVPDDMTLPEFVLQGFELYADSVAFVENESGKEYTHGEVVSETKRFAKALRSLGLRNGRVVVVLLPNVAEYAIVALGIMAAGGVFSGANPSGHASEIKKQVEAADARLIVTNGPNYEKVKILYTNGKYIQLLIHYTTCIKIHVVEAD